MMGGGDFARLLAPLEEWKLGDPDEFEGALVDQPKRSGGRLTHRSERRRGDLRPVRDGDHHIAGLRLRRLLQAGKLPLGAELYDRRAPALRLAMPEGDARSPIRAGGLRPGLRRLAGGGRRESEI